MSASLSGRPHTRLYRYRASPFSAHSRVTVTSSNWSVQTPFSVSRPSMPIAAPNFAMILAVGCIGLSFLLLV